MTLRRQHSAAANSLFAQTPPPRRCSLLTSVQNNLSKSRISDLLLLATANRFVPSWRLSSTWFLWPTSVSPKRHLDRFSRFCTEIMWPTHRQIHRPRYVWHLSQQAAFMLCLRYGLKIKASTNTYLVFECALYRDCFLFPDFDIKPLVACVNIQINIRWEL